MRFRMLALGVGNHRWRIGVLRFIAWPKGISNMGGYVTLFLVDGAIEEEGASSVNMKLVFHRKLFPEAGNLR